MVYWEKYAGDGAARKEETGKAENETEDMAVVEVTEEDAEVMTTLIWNIRCGDHCREKPKEAKGVEWRLFQCLSG